MMTAVNKVKVIANILRPYGIRVYLSINFASPMALGYTKTADPLDKKVQQWWQKKDKRDICYHPRLWRSPGKERIDIIY